MNSNKESNKKIKMIVLSDLHLLHSNQSDNIVIRDFERVLQYAARSSVSHVMLLGDTFDKEKCNYNIAKMVVDVIAQFPSIRVYMIYGNHEINDSCRLGSICQLPANMRVFGDSWGYEDLENCNVRIHGISSHENNDKYKDLTCPDDKYNVVLLHAKLAKNNYYDDSSVITDCKELSSADILCCGHIHVNEYFRKGFATRDEYFADPLVVVPGSINRYVKLKSNSTKPAFVVLEIDVQDGSAKLENTEIKHIDDIEVIATAADVEESVVEIADKMFVRDYDDDEIFEMTGMFPVRVTCHAYKRRKEINYSSHTFYST